MRLYDARMPHSAAGSEFTITKIEIEGNRKDWRIEGEEAPAPIAAAQQQGAQPNGKPASNGHPQKNGHAESAGFQDLSRPCSFA